MWESSSLLLWGQLSSYIIVQKHAQKFTLSKRIVSAPYNILFVDKNHAQCYQVSVLAWVRLQTHGQHLNFTKKFGRVQFSTMSNIGSTCYTEKNDLAAHKDEKSISIWRSQLKNY